MQRGRLCTAGAFAFFLALVPLGARSAGAPLITIETSGPAATAPLAGRMLLFIAPAHGPKPPDHLESGFAPMGVQLIGFDVNLPAGSPIAVPADARAFPKALDALRPGTYDIQPVLDRNRMYTYSGLTDGDLLGPVQRVQLQPGKVIRVRLSQRVAPPSPPPVAGVRLFSMRSPTLSAFYHTPTTLRASVILPKAYDATKRYPVVYSMTGFGGTYRVGPRVILERQLMAQDGLDAILVVTDSSGPTGITEFADSATNGPWGRAFTHDFVPALERAYPIRSEPSQRLLWGHSSGGWASLWLQVTYPDLFGGTWSSSPDPVDFHDFTGPDLLAQPPDNAFRDPYGKLWQLVRDRGQDVMSLRDFVLSSDVLGWRSSQFGSFDAVFSPPGADGKPLPLFDRHTGAVDPTVAGYWETHYDIASKIEREWGTRGRSLTNKLHVAVGTLDTFHLERGVLRLDARLRRLGITPDITYFRGATHGSIFRKESGFEGFHWAFRGMAAALQR